VGWADCREEWRVCRYTSEFGAAWDGVLWRGVSAEQKVAVVNEPVQTGAGSRTSCAVWCAWSARDQNCHANKAMVTAAST
jgi:hypothetical protein